jgi:hypothetical protein
VTMRRAMLTFPIRKVFGRDTGLDIQISHNTESSVSKLAAQREAHESHDISEA